MWKMSRSSSDISSGLTVRSVIDKSGRSMPLEAFLFVQAENLEMNNYVSMQPDKWAWFVAPKSLWFRAKLSYGLG